MIESDDTIHAGPSRVLHSNIDSHEEIDTLSTCFANYQRHVVAQCLSDVSDPITVEKLIQDMAEQSERNAAEKPQEDPEVDIAVSLLHNYHTKMPDAGIVAMNDGADTVQPGHRIEAARTLREVV